MSNYVRLLFLICLVVHSKAFPGQYIGCFKDNANRAMNAHKEIAKSVTPQMCINLCRTLGFGYAGLQNSDQCYCDDKYDEYGEADKSECDKPCAGNSTIKCGGDGTNDVYSICPAGKYGYQCLYDCPFLCTKNGSIYCDFRTGNCINGCYKGYSHCNSSEIDCYTLKSDPRKEVEKMNNSPGRWFNLFPSITFANTGKVSEIEYYASGAGDAFVSFWRKVPRTAHDWTMIGKEPLFAAHAGKHNATVSNDIYVSIGDAIAVHYNKNSSTQLGMIYYEKSGMSLSSGIRASDLTEFISYDMQDDGWKNWKTLSLPTNAYVQYIKRIPALHITVNCLQKSCPHHKYGPDCDHDCIPNCINSMCSPINGECLDGCINGWMGSHCNMKCPGHCKAESNCDRFRGICLDGCGKGFTGEKCDKECTGNTYGDGCINKCHCSNSSTCHHVTGSCPFTNSDITMCEKGWIGCMCDIPTSNFEKDVHVSFYVFSILVVVGLIISIGVNVVLVLRIRDRYGLRWCPRSRSRTNKSEEILKDDQTNAVQYEPFYGDEVDINGK